MINFFIKIGIKIHMDMSIENYSKDRDGSNSWGKGNLDIFK